ncbi:PTS mannitol transporter subunit IICBA [Cryobacterium sp. AP23]
MTQVRPPRKKDTLRRVQQFGNFLSGMVMPNLGVFVAWGLLTALFIPTGYLPNASLAELVSPIMTYALPLLIGFTGGRLVHGVRGGAIGALATMGVIVGSDVTMLMGAMIMGPIAGWLLKQVDRFFENRVKAGFEMLISNFSMGILGLGLVLAAFVGIGPVIEGLIAILSAGVDWILAHNLLPLLAIFVAPAQVLFLNNAINHGIMAPLGIEQVDQFGRSILFLVDANPGPSVGTLLAISIFGVGMAKNTAPMAAVIAGIGGIGEVYFPFVLMNPKLVFATMGGIATSLAMFVMFDGGTVATPSPGSIFAILALTPNGALAGNLIGFFAGMAVSFLIGAVLLKFGKGKVADDSDLADGSAEERDSFNKALLEGDLSSTTIRKIVVACDAGMGSSAMGASILKSKIRKAMLDVEVTNSKIEEIPKGVDLIVTHTKLLDRTMKMHDDGQVKFMAITNFVEGPQFDEIVSLVKRANGTTDVGAPAAASELDSSHIESPGVLVAANIELGRSFRTRGDAITATGEILVREGYVTPAYIESMHQRDELTSVYVGNHVAIPHGVNGSDPQIIRSGVSVVQVPEGVDFDGNIVYVLIGIAGKGDSHLGILSQIAQVLSDKAQVERIRSATSASEILDLLALKVH